MIQRSTPLKRSRMKSKPTIRRWTEADEKLRDELDRGCRACGTQRNLERAHVVPREYDEIVKGSRGGRYRFVNPNAVIWLCGPLSEHNHHAMFDSHNLDLLEVITEEEFEYAVRILGYERALKRVSGNA